MDTRHPAPAPAVLLPADPPGLDDGLRGLQRVQRLAAAQAASSAHLSVALDLRGLDDAGLGAAAPGALHAKGGTACHLS